MDTYVDFLGRLKRMQLANFSAADKKQIVNDALALLERHLFGSSSEIYFLAGLEAGATCLNLGQEVTAVQAVFRVDSNGVFIPVALYHDTSDFLALTDGVVKEETPWACLVANTLQIQQCSIMHVTLRNWEQFTAEQFGGTSQNYLVFNGISSDVLQFRILAKRGFKRIVLDNDTNLAITDYPDLLLLAVRQVIALERGNFKEVREVRAIFEDALFAAHRLLAQKDNDWLGENNG